MCTSVLTYVHGHVAQIPGHTARAKEIARAKGLRNHLAQERAQATCARNLREELVQTTCWVGLAWARAWQSLAQANRPYVDHSMQLSTHVQRARTQALTSICCCANVCVCVLASSHKAHRQLVQGPSAQAARERNSHNDLRKCLRKQLAQATRASTRF